MIEATETTVITPMITPSSVRKLRSLCVPRAVVAMRRVSMGCRDDGMSGRRDVERGSGYLPSSRLLVILSLLLFPHLSPVLQFAQRLERPGHDLLAFLEAGEDLDVALAGEAGGDGDELHRAILVEEHP